MVFTTPQFVLFFCLFFVVYGALRGQAMRKWFLLASSYFFYSCWSTKFLLLLIATTGVDFWVGGAVHAAANETRRRRLLSVSVVANLAVLSFFKYFNFFVDSASALLRALGLHVSELTLTVALPVGISFYTFHSMAYVIDIYRRRTQPAASFLDFALYVTFFPQLVAGPIARPQNLLPQVQRLSKEVRTSGWFLIAWGAFKKVAIADHMAGLVSATYAAPDAAYGPALWLSTYAFAIQIYCDFSGYSDIALGLGRLLGIELLVNFRAPYAAGSPSDFWQRWHISLSTWLRDYLYVPLGGNRGGTLATNRNLMITMLLGGLWHGAAWNFVLWGAFHGILLVFYRLAAVQALGRRLSRGALRWPAMILGRLLFFHLVCLSWVLFRAGSLRDCGNILARMLRPDSWRLGAWSREVVASGEARYLGFMFAVMVALVMAQNLWPSGSHAVAERAWRLPAALRFLVVVALLVAVVLLAPVTPPAFIYFQF